jgi:glucosamine kinase
MALLIGEIGGSSSRWAWTAEDRTTILPGGGEPLPGYNPLTGDGPLFAARLREQFALRAEAILTAEEVVVYGAGCGSPDRRASMVNALRLIWPAARMTVNTDLLGAARGLCQHGPGMVLILGTGMNVGWYDGARLHQPMPSLGYILGDEGSGADIGRALLQDAFYRRMPDRLRLALYGEDGPDLPVVLNEVYRSAFPSRALAAHTAQLAAWMDEAYVRELVTGRFHALIETMKPFFALEQREAVHATGSVAWGFREWLASCLLEHGMELMAVERDPLEGLVRWHQQGPQP